LQHLGSSYPDDGHHVVNWSFAGNANYAGASGSSTVDIAPASVSVSVSSSAPLSVPNQLVTFTVTVTPPMGLAAPSGLVSIQDGDTTIATASLNDGKAIFSTTSLGLGLRTHRRLPRQFELARPASSAGRT
jgi:hypothetical protein